MLATRKVTQNKGKRTAGIDGETWSSPKAKMKAALILTDKKYEAKPLRRVYIVKNGSEKKRPLGIPAMYDRAMQSLYALALEPIAEATGDRTSFGFRKYRSTHDACNQVFTCMSRRNSPKWVLEGDIKGCFSSTKCNLVGNRQTSLNKELSHVKLPKNSLRSTILLKHLLCIGCSYPIYESFQRYPGEETECYAKNQKILQQVIRKVRFPC